MRRTLALLACLLAASIATADPRFWTDDRPLTSGPGVRSEPDVAVIEPVAVQAGPIHLVAWAEEGGRWDWRAETDADRHPRIAAAFSRMRALCVETRGLPADAVVRRVLAGTSGEQVPVMAKKKVRRAAKKSVKQMRAVLTEHQLVYYEEYLELANRIFLREAGLR